MSSSSAAVGGGYARINRSPLAEQISEQLLSQQQEVRTLSDLWLQGFERLELLEAASEFSDAKVGKLLKCYQLTQTYVEQKQQEHELQMEATRAELNDTRAALSQARQQLGSLGRALDDTHSAVNGAVRQALRDHTAAVDEQMAELRRALRALQPPDGPSVAIAEARAANEARVRSLEDRLNIQARENAQLREEVAAQRGALMALREEVAAHREEREATADRTERATRSMASPGLDVPADAERAKAEAAEEEVASEVAALAERVAELGAVQLGMDQALEARTAALRAGQAAVEAQQAQQGREGFAVAHSVLALQRQMASLQQATAAAVTTLQQAAAGGGSPQRPSSSRAQKLADAGGGGGLTGSMPPRAAQPAASLAPPPPLDDEDEAARQEAAVAEEAQRRYFYHEQQQLQQQQMQQQQQQQQLSELLSTERQDHASTATRASQLEMDLAASLGQQHRLQQQLLLIQASHSHPALARGAHAVAQ